MNIDLLRSEYKKLKTTDRIEELCKKLSPKAKSILVYIITILNVRKDTPTSSMDLFSCEFSLEDYYAVTKSKETTINIIEQALEELRQTTYWVPLENDEQQCVSWLKDVRISANGYVKVELHKFVGLGLGRFSNSFPYSEMKGSFPDWGMKSQYGNRLYQFFRRGGRSEIVCWVDEVRNELGATAASYNRYSNFNQRILEPAVREINNCTEICVEYRKINTKDANGKKMEGLRFFITPKHHYLRPDFLSKFSRKRLNIREVLLSQEIEIPPATEVPASREAQHIQGSKEQFLPTKQVVGKQSSTSDESETEDLPF